MMNPKKPDYLTTVEVAQLLRISERTVEQWRWAKKGPPSFKVGKHVLYARDELNEWIRDTRTAQEVSDDEKAQ